MAPASTATRPGRVTAPSGAFDGSAAVATIVKVFNNNTVLAVDEHGHEFVASGLGLGFQARPGTVVDHARVERTYRPSRTAPAERIVALLEQLPPTVICAVEQIIGDARRALGEHVTEHMVLPMADHVTFALERLRVGAAQVEYPFGWEVEHLYPNEFAVARSGLDVIERATGSRLPDIEAIPLAMHLVNAQFRATSADKTMQTTAVLRDILGIISSRFDLTIDGQSMDVARFVTHLRYLFTRAVADTTASRPVNTAADAVSDSFRVARPAEFAAARQVGVLLAERFGWHIDGDEQLYLALHVARLVDSSRGRSAADDGGFR